LARQLNPLLRNEQIAERSDRSSAELALTVAGRPLRLGHVGFGGLDPQPSLSPDFHDLRQTDVAATGPAIARLDPACALTDVALEIQLWIERIPTRLLETTPGDIDLTPLYQKIAIAEEGLVHSLGQPELYAEGLRSLALSRSGRVQPTE
jgi:hypothetical protein